MSGKGVSGFGAAGVALRCDRRRPAHA